MSLELDGVNGIIKNTTSDGDVTIKGNDGGSEISALTLDMSDAGTATFNHDIKLNDSGALRLGDDGDAEIYHNGSATVVREASSGNLVLAGNDVQITGGSMLETHIDCNNNGSVDLYHNNVKKFETTSSGVTVTGATYSSGGVFNTVNNSLLIFGGGNAGNVGSNLTMYGGADGSAGTFRFRNATTTHFNIAGNGDLTGTDTSIGSISDSRLKENITDFTYDVVKFKQFKPKTFDWKNPAEHNGRTDNRGFIAQEIAEIDDYWTDQITINSDTEDAKLISADSDGNHNSYSLKLGKKDAMYISVIQQLITRIETLEG
jgi:hypothetical protein